MVLYLGLKFSNLETHNTDMLKLNFNTPVLKLQVLMSVIKVASTPMQPPNAHIYTTITIWFYSTGSSGS